MAYRALYRSYRSKKFSEVVGQEAVVKALRNQVRTGNIGHAYLFAGPRGIGKTTIARLLANAVNCLDPQDGEACGVCDVCKVIADGGLLDILEVDAASNTRVEEIKSVLANVNYYPSIGKYRVYIIDEIHMLSKHAFNSLLKTLEEPPAHVIFMLATTEPTSLPDTILSRCQRYELTRIPTGLISLHLNHIAKDLKLNIDEKAILAIARSAEGGMRDALSLMDQCLALSGDTIRAKDVYAMLGSADSRYYFALLDSILLGDVGRTISGISSMTGAGCEPVVIARELLRYFMDLLIVLNGSGSGLPLDETHMGRLKTLAKKASNGTILRILSQLSLLEGDMRYAKQPGILLELAVVRSCRIETENSYDGLLERLEILERKFEDGVTLKAIAAKDQPGYVDDNGQFVHTADDVERPVLIEEIVEESSEVKPAIVQDSKPPTRILDESQEPPAEFFAKGFIPEKLPDRRPYVEEASKQTANKIKDEIVKEPIKKDLPLFFDSNSYVEQEEKKNPLLNKKDEVNVPAKMPVKAKNEEAEATDAAAPIIDDSIDMTPQELWNTAAQKLNEENKAMLSHFMQKGRAVSLKQGILTVKWPPDASHIIEIIRTTQNTIPINQALSQIADRKINLHAEGELITQEQTDFISDTIGLLKDFAVDRDLISIDYSDDDE